MTLEFLDGNPCLLIKCSTNTERNCPISGECNDCNFFER